MSRVKIFQKGNRLIVESRMLDNNPLLDLPISEAIKFKSKYIPDVRLSLNEWFQKHF